jgi:S-adenosylmethionine decarboxylase
VEALGKHLLLELIDCDAGLLNDIEYLRKVVSDTARQIGATVIIAESHIAIHTWPEYRFAAVDVFTCGDVIDPKNAVSPFVEKLKAKSSSYIEMKRGLGNEVREAVSWK